MITYTDIKREFEESLGYIRNDIAALCADEHKTVNYTVALLIGCACEALADAGAYASKEQAFADLMPDDDWRKLAQPLFNAVRNGLAHSFDTKPLFVNGQEVQIHFNWHAQRVIDIRHGHGLDRLHIGPRLLAARLCGKIDAFRAKLQQDNAACQKFRDALLRDRTVKCSEDVWNVLKRKTAHH